MVSFSATLRCSNPSVAMLWAGFTPQVTKKYNNIKNYNIFDHLLKGGW